LKILAVEINTDLYWYNRVGVKFFYFLFYIDESIFYFPSYLFYSTSFIFNRCYFSLINISALKINKYKIIL